MELLLVDLCKDTMSIFNTEALIGTRTTAGAIFDVPTFRLFRLKNRPSYPVNYVHLYTHMFEMLQ